MIDTEFERMRDEHEEEQEGPPRIIAAYGSGTRRLELHFSEPVKQIDISKIRIAKSDPVDPYWHLYGGDGIRRINKHGRETFNCEYTEECAEQNVEKEKADLAEFFFGNS